MRTFAALWMRPGEYGECGDIRLFFRRFKNTHLLLSASKTKAVGKDGGCGQRERNVSLLGEVHRRHDGAPSSSWERRRREEHRVSLHFYSDSYIIMDILMNLLILFTFYSLLQGIYPEDTASAAGEEETAAAAKKMGGNVGGGGSAARK